MSITPEARAALRQMDIKIIRSHPETAHAHIVGLLNLFERAESDLKAADAFNKLCKDRIMQVEERNKILERHKDRLLASVNRFSECPGNGWKYDWMGDEKGCFPVPDEYSDGHFISGIFNQCRACWEAALEADVPCWCKDCGKWESCDEGA